jgi:hypothetical protein
MSFEQGSNGISFTQVNFFSFQPQDLSFLQSVSEWATRPQAADFQAQLTESPSKIERDDELAYQ